jgi:hypothetical protein
MVRPLETCLSSRQRAHIEEQRTRDVSAAFARLGKALENTARPAWRPSTPDRLRYLPAKLDRRISDPSCRYSAAELIGATIRTSGRKPDGQASSKGRLLKEGSDGV